MSENTGNSSQGDNTKKNEDNTSMPTPVPEASSSAYPTGPIQFRVRGSNIAGASPPKFVSLEEIMKTAHGIQDMALAHEIAVDQDFRLEPFEPPDNSYQKLVKETLHKAFFDILREQLSSDPPVYKQALVLLEDVKKGLYSILLPRHTRIRQMISEVLDGDFIRQQAEHGALDFKKYAAFVIDLMAKLAAPARDEMIQNIGKLDDTVDIFRSILEALETMKLDLANTLVAMIRPHVRAQSVALEKNKFSELLKLQEDGLQHTRAWLMRHIDRAGVSCPTSDPQVIRNVTARSLARAYVDLLEWTDPDRFPETVLMDTHRFADLSLSVRRLVWTASVLLVSPTVSLNDASAAADFKKRLRERIYIILGDVETLNDFRRGLPAAAEEVVAETERLLAGVPLEPLSAEVRAAVREQVGALAAEDHAVVATVRKRVLEFLQEVLVCSGGSRPVPVGLSAFSAELTSIAGTLLRIVMHNKAVYTEYYMEIVAAELAKC